MLLSPLAAVFAFFWYQTVLTVAYFTAHVTYTASGGSQTWIIAYWLVIVTGVNIFGLIVYHG